MDTKVYETIKNTCFNRAKEIYGEILPDVVRNRLEIELNNISNQGSVINFAVSQKISEYLKQEGYVTSLRGSIASSFVVYLLGISDMNPLPTHYICPNCKHIAFTDSMEHYFFADLDDAECPHCNTKLIKEGYNLIPEMVFGLNGEINPYFDFLVPQEYLDTVREKITEMFGKDFLYQTVGIDIIGSNVISALCVLQKETGILARNIPLNDKETLNEIINGDMKGIEEFEQKHIRNMIASIKPSSLSDIIRGVNVIHGMSLSDDSIKYPQYEYMQNPKDIVATKDDVMNLFISKGFERGTAYKYMRGVFKHKLNQEIFNAMSECGVKEQAIDLIRGFYILLPKSYVITCILQSYYLAWYKVHYLNKFEKIITHSSQTKHNWLY